MAVHMSAAILLPLFFAVHMSAPRARRNWLVRARLSSGGGGRLLLRASYAPLRVARCVLRPGPQRPRPGGHTAEWYLPPGMVRATLLRASRAKSPRARRAARRGQHLARPDLEMTAPLAGTQRVRGSGISRDPQRPCTPKWLEPLIGQGEEAKPPPPPGSITGRRPRPPADPHGPPGGLPASLVLSWSPGYFTCRLQP